jgi:putative ABC transport system permease protein
MLKLALRNLLRHPLRAGVTLAAIVFGIVALILGGGFVRDMYVQLGEALIHSQSGHIQLAKTGYFTHGSRYPEKHQLEDMDTLARGIAALPEVELVMARSHFSGLLSNGRTDRPVIGEGVEPGKEARLGTYLEVVAGRALADTDRFGAMIGQGVSQTLGLEPGDQVTLLANTVDGSLNTLEIEIVGIFRTFSRDFDARAIRIPLEAARELTGVRGANVLVVGLRATPDTERVATLLKERVSAQPVEVRTWIELNDFFEKTVALYDRQFGVIQLITMILVLLGVANSVNMSVFERIGEFGTMMALGNRSGYVFRLIMVETVLLGLAGAVLGALLGTGLALAISSVGIPMPPPPNANVGYSALIRVSPDLVGLACAIGFLAATLAAILPAKRASRVPVVDALRFNI